MKLQDDPRVVTHQVGAHGGMRHLDVLKEVRLRGEALLHTEDQRPQVLHQVLECGRLHQVMPLLDLLHQEILLQDIQHRVSFKLEIYCNAPPCRLMLEIFQNIDPRYSIFLHRRYRRFELNDFISLFRQLYIVRSIWWHFRMQVASS